MNLIELSSVLDDKVEIVDQRVAVCRDHVKGACHRKQCKFYHIPIDLPPAYAMTNSKPVASTLYELPSTTIDNSK